MTILWIQQNDNNLTQPTTIKWLLISYLPRGRIWKSSAQLYATRHKLSPGHSPDLVTCNAMADFNARLGKVWGVQGEKGGVREKKKADDNLMTIWKSLKMNEHTGFILIHCSFKIHPFPAEISSTSRLILQVKTAFEWIDHLKALGEVRSWRSAEWIITITNYGDLPWPHYSG